MAPSNPSLSMLWQTREGIEAVDFREQLLDHADVSRLMDNPFVKGIQSKRYSPQALSLYASRLQQIVDQFPNQLARLLAICPLRTVRLHIVENMMEEEGFLLEDSQLRYEETKAHPYLLQSFGAALPQPRPDSWANGNQGVDKWLSGGCWQAVAAFHFVGIETGIFCLFEQLIPAFIEQYGFDAHSLEFFTEHLYADEIHSARGVDMLVAHCLDTSSQSLALEGARHGARTWYGFHSVCARDMERLDSLLVSQSR